MRTTERLRGLKQWVKTNLCDGRELKAPDKMMDIANVQSREPKCFLAWAPGKMDAAGRFVDDSLSVCPGIIIMPNQAYAKYTEEKRFDRYNNIHRSQDLGQHLSVSILFILYEPGNVLPGFDILGDENGRGIDTNYIQDGTEQGLMALMDWMDDCKEYLLRDKGIPGTDLMVSDTTMTYSLYTDQEYVVDRRPIYYGFVNVTFDCYAEHGANQKINDLLL